jgi:hypothetical protein
MLINPRAISNKKTIGNQEGWDLRDQPEAE